MASRHVWRVIGAAVAGASVPLSAGCASAGMTTCAEYASHDRSDRRNIVIEMIRDRGLDPGADTFAVVEVGREINLYCGMADSCRPAPARRDAPIVGGVHWSTFEE
ncbi:hypothetical protein [Xylanimonas ulmi]|uniref:Uncharacterized protein n=1 Tax=Xylanimonas ulmi TaxID=228973 RepID=A0A4Q7M5Y9_9MICO|nr:hypothetical protein [Xylanibacterium ulmi]RZS62427.1 hypothetical protein EV386_2760 [Xylanibacterium ulmi]